MLVQTNGVSNYDFYAMYPAKAVKSGSGKGHIAFCHNARQTELTTEVMTDEAVGEFQTTADMDCALMIAEENGL